jgi:sugar O-acyltransferase (sialic acid O-acetyltransferase NeuD family)
VKNLYILGTSGLAREIAQLVKQINKFESRYNFCGFIGHDKDEIGRKIIYGDIMGDDEWLIAKNEECSIIIGIGFPKIRVKLFEEYSQHSNFDFPNLIHPTAIFDFDVNKIGKGNIITAGCIFTNNITVGDNNLFNLNCTIGHDSSIFNHNVINPTCCLSGNVKIGDCNLIGTGAQILDKLQIGNFTVIGGGALVRKPVLDNTRVAGVPAKEF